MAQINRTILGVKIGSTTRNEMPNLFPEGHFQKHKLEAISGSYETFEVENATFAGVQWRTASFSFRDGKVEGVTFKDNYYDEKAKENLYRDVYISLRKKYPYYEKESLKSGFKYFTDNKMTIKLSLENRSCSLSYSTYSKYGYDLFVKIGYLKGDGITTSDL